MNIHEMQSTLNLKERSLYKFWHTEHVRYADLEPQDHVNNMVIGVYFQSARIALLHKINLMWETPDRAIVIARTINDFYKEITYPNNLEIGVAVTRFGNTSFTLSSGIFINDQCTATQESVCVYWNPVLHEKRPLDNSARDRLSSYQS